MRLEILALIPALSMFASVAAQAVPVEYSLRFTADELYGTDGIGSFFYDAETYTVSGLNWDFGSGVSGFYGNVLNDSGRFLGEYVLLGGCPSIGCGFAAGSGAIGFFDAFAFNVDNRAGTHRYQFSQNRTDGLLYRGSFTTSLASNVPAPGPLGLFCVGLVLLAVRRRRIAA